MGADDDQDCPHMWRLAVVTLDTEGGHAEYRCELCDGLVIVPPGGAHPATA